MEENANYSPLDIKAYQSIKMRRRELLPWWIKFFSWVFMIAGLLVPFGIVLGGIGHNVQISLYGFETTDPISLIGSFLIVLFLIKAITGYGLWTGKKWAVDLGIFDAVIGLLVCVAAMLLLPLIDTSSGFVLKFRLEPIILIIYLLRLQKIKPFWTAE